MKIYSEDVITYYLLLFIDTLNDVTALT